MTCLWTRTRAVFSLSFETMAFVVVLVVQSELRVEFDRACNFHCYADEGLKRWLESILLETYGVSSKIARQNYKHYRFPVYAIPSHTSMLCNSCR